jgi:hypothetical protein
MTPLKNHQYALLAVAVSLLAAWPVAAPAGEDVLRARKALEAYRDEYSAAPDHRAFAQSPATGAWAWRSKRASAELATSDALRGCNQYVANPNDRCVIVNVDGKWLDSSIADDDAGTYVLLGNDDQPTELYYRLSRPDGRWLMEGKEPKGEWKNISCDAGCQYRQSTDAEVDRYFLLQRARAQYETACIQNIAQAFCRYRAKDDPSVVGYVVVALVTPVPILMRLRRVGTR